MGPFKKEKIKRRKRRNKEKKTGEEIFMRFIFLGFINLTLSTFLLTACTSSEKRPKGVYFENLRMEPENLHPVKSSDVYASIVQGYVMDTLMIRDVETYEFKPYLAHKYTVSEDKKVYRFYLRKNAKFHDGKPVTAYDVKFYYDAIHDPKFEALNAIPYFEGLKSVKVIDDHTLEIELKNTYFGNFATMANLTAVPRHVYDNDKKNSKILIGSGAYKLSKYNKGQSIVLEKNPDWWGKGLKDFERFYRIPKIYFRFIQEDQVSLEVFKKGQLDFIGLSPEDYMTKTEGEGWGKNYFKKKVQNSAPKSYGYVGWNLKNDLFKNRKVRWALTHLMNRELMIKKFLFSMSLPATGPWYQQSPYAAKVKPFEYNPKKASKLLKQAGWSDSNKDGILDKKIKGKRLDFKFTLLISNKEMEKYFTIYKEDLKKVGVHMELQFLEWTSFLKKLDEGGFEAITLGWGGGSVDNDPKQIWHSSSIGKGGSNFISYSNPEVDKLIDKGRNIMDRQKRIKVYKEIYKKIAYDAPYVFMFNSLYHLYAVSDRVVMEKDTYKYDLGKRYWQLTQ